MDLQAPSTLAFETMPLMPQYSCTKGLMTLGFVQPHLCGELSHMFGKAWPFLVDNELWQYLGCPTAGRSLEHVV